MPVDPSATKICKNCGFALESAYDFCPKCGQEHKEKIIYFKQFLLDFLGDYFTFDSKIVRSVWPLILKPGFLTQEYLAGRRVRYIPPLRMYIFISVVFFIFLGTSKTPVRLSGDGLDAEFFDAYFDVWLPRLFFFLLPLFAFITHVLFRRKGHYYLSSFIFSVHFHAFVLLFFSAYIVITSFALHGWYSVNQWVLAVMVLLLQVYLYVSLKNVFGQRAVITLVKMLLLNMLYALAVVTVFIGIAVLIYKMQY